MFGFIKKIFGGIFSFLGGLFGKKSEYFLELEDSKSEPTAKPQPAKPEPAKVEKTEPAPAPAAKAEPAKATKTGTEKKTVEKAPAPAAVASNGQAIAKKDLQEKAPEPVGGFATKYLVPTPNTPRRRPGANMGSFLDMARNVQMSSR